MSSAGGPRARTSAAFAATIAALALAGCGLGSSASETRQISLLVTADHGARPVAGSQRTLEISGKQSAAELLEREHVDTAKGGSLFVNGVRPEEAETTDPKPLGKVEIHRADEVWWDEHAPAGPTVRAVVGSFPEPFAHGIDGKRVPARLECDNRTAAACDIAVKALNAAGTGIVGRSNLGTIPGENTIVVLVGLWPDLRGDFAARSLESGPRKSGVFARIAPDGDRIALLDAAGRTVRTLGAGTGLVAATTFDVNRPTWIVTGTDIAGLRQAARALTEDALNGKYAVAIRDDLPIALPAS